MKQIHRSLSSFYLILAVLVIVQGCAPFTKEPPVMEKSKAAELHQRLLTLDSHMDTPLRLMGEGIDLGKRYDPREYRSKLDLDRMDEGGLDAVFFAIWTAQGARTDSAHMAVKQKALDIMAFTREQVSKYPDRVGLAIQPEDAGQLASQGKHAIYFGMENGYPIGRDLKNVNLFYQEGIRYITLCHTSNNEICDSSMDDPEFGGLSPFGEQVVRRMNELGIMVDISHVSDAAVQDVLNLSTTPVIASHSCAQRLCSHVRNLNDSLITAIAEKGGVIQLALFSEYITDEQPNPQRDSARAALKDKWGDLSGLGEAALSRYRQERRVLNETYPRYLPTVADAVDHIDHMVDLVGVDHVGIGSDFDGGGELADCYDVSEFPRITEELLRRDYTADDIQKIWGANLLRVFELVTLAAKD